MIQWQAKTAWLGTSTAQIATEVLYCCLGLSQNSWLPKLDSWIHRETHQPLIRGPFRYRIYGSYPPKLPPLGPHPNISQLKCELWSMDLTESIGIYRSIYLSIHPSIHLSIQSIHPSIYPSVSLSLFLSLYLSLSIHPTYLIHLMYNVSNLSNASSLF